MLVLKIGIEGKTTDDLQKALNEIKRKISDGYITGFDSNEDGRYAFDVAGKEEGEEE